MKKPRPVANTYATSSSPEQYWSQYCYNTDSNSSAVKVPRLTLKKRRSIAIGMIADACKILQWGIAVPKRTHGVGYLIIGEQKWLDRIDKRIDKRVDPPKPRKERPHA